MRKGLPDTGCTIRRLWPGVSCPAYSAIPGELHGAIEARGRVVGRNTEGIGVSEWMNGIHAPAELGECGGGTGALTPVPQAHSDSTGRTRGLMLPWPCSLRTLFHAVQFATEQAYAW